METKEWVAEMPPFDKRPYYPCIDEDAVQALVTRANAELTKVRAERDALRNECSACSYRDVLDKMRNDLTAARARIAELEAGETRYRTAIENMREHRERADARDVELSGRLCEALARIAELEAAYVSMEEERNHCIMRSADDERTIAVLLSAVNASDSDGWSPVTREAMSGEQVRIRFRNGLSTGETVASYEIEYGEYGVVEWEGWTTYDLDESAEVFAWKPLATVKEPTT
jgi:hypothetical protein